MFRLKHFLKEMPRAAFIASVLDQEVKKLLTCSRFGRTF